MEEVNRLALKQQELGEKITKSIRNMKKDPPTRKTLDYVTRRLRDLEEVWAEAEENHRKIVALKKEEHNYHTSQFFAQMQRRYDESMGYLNALKDGLEAAPTPDEKDEEQLNRIKMQELRIRKLSEKLRKIQEEIIGTHTKEYYDTKRNHIITWWNPIETLDDEIQLAGTEQQEEYFREEKFQEIYSLYNEVLNQLLDKTDNAVNQAKQCNITLPKITIPIFDGRYERWTNFHELFDKIIDSNTTLSKVEKMQYLTTNLKGEARKVIQHLQLAEANYETAWELLKNRYENKRLLLNKMLDKVLDLPVVTQESADKLKNLYDTTTECVEAIKNMGIDTTTWGPMVMRILARKWDGETNKMYEQTLKSPHEIQEFPAFMEFLLARFQSLEAMAESRTKSYPEKTLTQGKWPPRKPQLPPCAYCQQPQHSIAFCPKFKVLSITERNQVVNQKKLCKMCLSHDASQKCFRPKQCRVCNKDHNDLLHKEQTTPQRGQQATRSASHIGAVAESTAQEEEVITVANHVGRQKQDVLLATALVRAKTVTGSLEMLRVLVDPGSQASFITEEAAQLLALPKQKIRAEITGLGANNPKEARTKVTVEVQPRFPSTFRLTTELMVLSTVTKILPSKEVEGIKMEKWQNYLLADPTFNKPGPIDVLLGAADYTIILQEGILKTEAGLLGQNTEFGWVLSGCQGTEERNDIKIVSMMTRIGEDLTRFWEIEEIPETQKLSKEDVMCEEHYEQTHRRNEDGTYTVKIPFKEEQPQLGESKQRAMARFFQLEKRLAKDRKLGDEYKQFMQEYLDLGHMKRIVPYQEADAAYYIPHQAVIKETSTTTKLRVVFDASSKTSNGVSLNERMLTGPRLQQDLFDTILRWRKHNIAFTADIEKMYRQIKVHEEDQKYQRILWRFEPTQPIQEYGLTTVTYGTTAAPYLAIKTLQQLAQDEQENFPKAFPVVMKDFYVDDLLSGADSEEEAHQVQGEIISLLQAGGFTIRKWASNKAVILQSIPEELVDQTAIELTEDGVKKTLGVYWKPAEDIFQFKVECSNKEATTKRLILSEIAKLFDPLGWLAPIVIKAKMMVQELWTIESGWDQEVPGEIKNRWLKFHSELKSVEEIKFPRWINYSKKECKIELHGFADASEKAFGAVIYSKTISKTGETNITLLVAKSKVAPIKMKKTLPRLELCAAVLLAKLLKRTKAALEIEDVPTFAWTDSMITIAWIKGEPGKWKTFVANRVSEIQEELPSSNWNHVRTENNPADVISRDIEPSKLRDHLIWWNGPEWLKETTHWPRMEIIPTQEEVRVCHQIRVVEKEDGNKNTVNVNVAMLKPPEEQPKKRNNIPMGVVKYMLLLMSLSSCINNMVQGTYTIKYPKPGLYVEHIGSAQIDRGTFRIEMKFPKERIKEDEEAVNRTVAQMEDFCDQLNALTEHAQCLTLTHHLNEQQEQLKWSIRSMEGIISRKTRGVLGNLLTSIFGVNDEVYKDIDALDKNQRDLIQASNHQTKFMLSAVSTFNETEVRIQKKLNQFREKLNQGLDAIKEMEKWYRTIDENKLNLHILNTYQVVTNYIEELQLQYNKLLDVHFERGHLYEFISPAHISEIISTANEKMPSGIKVLAHPIQRTKVEHSQQYIHIFGYFEIAEITDFTVINVTPIPLKAENGTYWTLEVPSEILAIDYNSQSYFELTQEEYEKSIFLENNKLLCSPTVVRSIENSPHCIIDEIYSRKENNTCKIRKDQIWTIIWKQLSIKNTWMFIIDKPTRIAVTCNGNREDVKLNTSGIIQISQDCIIKTQQNILTPKMFDNIPVLAGYEKPVEVHINTSFIMESNKYHQIRKEPVFKDMEQLRTLVDEERNIQEGLHENTWRRVRNHSVISSSLTTAIIVITAVMAFLSYKCYTQTRQNAHSARTKKTARSARPSTTEIEMQPLYSMVARASSSNASSSSRTPQNV